MNEEQQADPSQGSESRLHIKHREPPTADNPMVTRMPPPGTRRRIPGLGCLVKTLLTVLILGGIAFAGLYFPDYGDPEQAAPWDKVADAFDLLQDDVSNGDAYAKLGQALDVLSKRHGDDKAIAGTMTVFALGVMYMGNEDLGVRVAERVVREYPETIFAGMAGMTNFWMSCPECGGKQKQICPVCNGSGKCPTCNGKGYRVVATERKKGLSGAGLKKPESQNTRRLGTSLSNSGARHGREPCLICRGTGVCPRCRGTGHLTTTCGTCDGSGRILSKPKIKRRLNQALEEAPKYVGLVQKKAEALGMLASLKQQLKDAIGAH